MSLDVTLVATKPTEVYWRNITHNLNKMAMEAGIYQHLWRPEELSIAVAGELVEPLAQGLRRLKANPEHFRKFNAPNGWGTYENFVDFVADYLEACQSNPNAEIHVSR